MNLFKKKPKILITNDDGIDAAGLWLLAEAATKYGEVIIVAPSEEQSAMSHGITTRRGLDMRDYPSPNRKIRAYHVSGKPADCVIMAHERLNIKFDYVFSGVNHGTNLGIDINYSGTVGAASEAIIFGVPSAAFSSALGDDEVTKNELSHVLELCFQKQLWRKETILNINFPSSRSGKSKGIRITSQAQSMERPFIEGSDLEAWDQGFISLTPIGIDRTRYDLLKQWEKYSDER